MKLDLDRLAEMEEERAFLLGSLRDLDRERDAGDLDEHDYATLKDDYTARAARLLREIDGVRDTIPERPGRRPGRVVAAVVAVLGLGVGAGALVAANSGERLPTDTFTGDITPSAAGDASDAQAAAQAGDFEQAIELSDRALEADPDDVETLAYRGWFSFQWGQQSEVGSDREARIAAGVADLDSAIELDSAFLPAQVFKAVTVLRTGGDPLDALARIDAVLAARPPAEVATLAGSFKQQVIDEALVSAATLVREGEALQAIQTYDAVLASDPDNASTLAVRGYNIGLVGVQAQDTTLMEQGLADLDRAIELQPTFAEAVLFRAMIAYEAGGDAATAIEEINRGLDMSPPPDEGVASFARQFRSEIVAAGEG
jgi:tetratricopeptide (TPR) repeat protein